MKNFVKVKCWIPFVSYYMYLDSDDFVADELFFDHDIPWVWFSSKQFKKPNTSYSFVFCKILSVNEEQFEEAMEHLIRKLEFLGYDMEEYEELCTVCEMI